ncbi:unnamed protein product [Allacma fusca]|uniref:NHR domain-containing protein n=1 Tax=Allacma fusca TaxID=39272 RepID=A0A8J2PB84_9HEXA|nr:unnamed protein product [Allacma fusca]
MRTNQGELVFFINTTSQGVAIPFTPADLYAVISLYGKCAQVSLVDVEPSDQSRVTFILAQILNSMMQLEMTLVAFILALRIIVKMIN